MVNRARWLSLTPEPERELPRLVATLREGRPAPASVASEQARIEHLILHGTQRSWLAYLHSVVELIGEHREPYDHTVERARARAAEVIANHHHLLLAVAPRAAVRLAGERERLAAELRAAMARG